MKKPFSLIFVLIILLSFSFINAAPPQLPMIVSGDVYINDNPAKIGTEITAMFNDEEVASSEVSEVGKFTLLLQKLEEGQEIQVFVDGIYTNESIFYKSGDFQQLTLKVEKSYLIYYFGVALVLLIAGLLIWKQKSTLKRKKK
ncbi:MAG: hypothetical protein WD876_03845 [Candidatus Pacearchaeota archaeon]